MRRGVGGDFRPMSERLTFAVECRASDDGPMLHGVILQEGRAAAGGAGGSLRPSIRRLAL